MEDSKNLIQELLQGMELARQLRIYLNVSSSSSNETREILIGKIISTFEKAIEMVNHKGHVNVGESSQQQQQHTSGTVAIRMFDSPPLSSSPRSEDSDRDHNTPRKRNTLPIRWTKQIRVSPGMAVEGPLDDGYSWRKYGQKDILGAIHPRGYYRCTHRNVQGCLATKQVQRSDEDPTIIEITYRGNHTCNMASLNPIENQETNIVNTNPQSFNHEKPNEQRLNNLRTSLRVQTENLDFLNQSFAPLIHLPSTSELKFENHVLESSYAENFNSPSYVSPANSGIGHFSMSPSSSGFQNVASEMIPLATSAANTPTTTLDFPFDQFQFDGQNFTFDHSPFFP
ncbi:probable WRKY transcription factor 30 [Trifolium pratense]|uniref:probable WRKY transcription factor 30 n=1 Tax=Trifolium pratense TaxID=57577 RepID=UPI001E692047|nr:probable WRKY transcription factor 30 [Trifolium pratense]